MTEPDLEETVRRMYAHFNARKIDEVLGLMHADVDWPNAIEGTRLTGHDAVREYWLRQFGQFDPRVEPVAFQTREGGRLRVRVDQSVRDFEGNLLDHGDVFHDYTFRDGRIARMDVAEAPPRMP